MEINLRRQAREEREGGGQTQGHDDRENIEIGSQLRGTTSRTVPHLKEEMDQMKKVMEEMKENMRRANPIEDLVHRTDSPFTASINGHPLPPKFKMPSLDLSDGTRDPFDHIATFKTTMHLQGCCEILKYSQVYKPYQSIVGQEQGRTHRDLNECRKDRKSVV